MIRSALGPDAIFYRMHAPRWAHQPLSGAGAALKGGRLNRPGLEALYLSDQPETAIAEYQQTDALLPPGTLVAYQVTLGAVADFRGGFDPAQWDEAWREFWCDWRHEAFVNRVDPASWLLGDVALSEGLRGIWFPSVVRPGGTNLVIYIHDLDEGDRVMVHDPRGDLPRDQESWLQKS